MMAQMLELLSIQRKAARVKEMYAQFDERNEQKQVDRRDRMGTDLRRDLIQTEDPSEHHDQNRRDPHGRVNPDDYAQGQAPRQTARCYPAAQLAKQRTQYSATNKLAYRFGHKHIQIGRVVTVARL